MAPAPVSAARLAPSQEDLARRVLQSGQAFLRERKYTEAMSDFQFIVDRFPSSSVADDALFEIAVYESAAGGNIQRATEATTRLRTLYPDSDWAPFGRVVNAIMAYRGREYARARDELDAFLNRRNVSTATGTQREMVIAAHRMRALARLALRDREGARSDFRTLLMLDPSTPPPPEAPPGGRELFAEVRAATVRDVRFTVRPEDADVRLASLVDGRVISVRLTEPRVVPLVIGSSHTVVASRNGYAGVDIPFIVEPGVTPKVVDLVLGRP
jgi:tetratricopeptide (TPR) repeat protein